MCVAIIDLAADDVANGAGAIGIFSANEGAVSDFAGGAGVEVDIEAAAASAAVTSDASGLVGMVPSTLPSASCASIKTGRGFAADTVDSAACGTDLVGGIGLGCGSTRPSVS